MTEELGPFKELQLLDLQVKAAAVDEMRTHFDPEVHPRKPKRSDPDEPSCDSCGKPFDLQEKTPPVSSDLLDVDTGASDDLMLNTDPVEDELNP